MRWWEESKLEEGSSVVFNEGILNIEIPLRGTSRKEERLKVGEGE